jgi:hypothetical protein
LQQALAIASTQCHDTGFRLNVESSTTKAPGVQLLRAIGGLVRGLSILFWSLPLTFMVYLGTASLEWFRGLGSWAFAPAVVLSLTIFYALRQLRHFQRQERVWQYALDAAELTAVINAGLSPFLCWWHRFPAVPLYGICVCLLLISSFLLLIQINHVLNRLSAMLPDEMLRAESKLFTACNVAMLGAGLALWGFHFALRQWRFAAAVAEPFGGLDSPAARWLMLFLALVPLAMTLSLTWKIKEVLFASLFNAQR